MIRGVHMHGLFHCSRLSRSKVNLEIISGNLGQRSPGTDSKCFEIDSSREHKSDHPPPQQPRLEYFHFCWLRNLKACHAHKHKQMLHSITSLAVRCTMSNHVAFFRIQFNYKEMENTLLLPGRQRQIRSIRKSSAEDR